MAQPRKKLFGPLFYSTLVLAVLVTLYTAMVSVLPWLEERRDLQRLVDSLRSADANTRATAASSLAMRGDQRGSSPYLMDATRDSRPEVRAVAFSALTETSMNLNVVLPVLLAASRDSEAAVRRAAAKGIGRAVVFTSQSVPSSPETPGGLAPDSRERILKALRVLLKDPSSEVRAAAVSSLGEFGTAPTTPPDLLGATSDEDGEVRLAASVSLLKLNGNSDPIASRTLLAMLSDPEPVLLRSRVAEVLKGTSESVQDQAVSALMTLLANADSLLLHEAVDCLSVFGVRSRPALPAIEALLRDQDQDPNTRAAAENAFGEIEGKNTPGYLAMQLKTIADPTMTARWRQYTLNSVREVNAPALTKATPGLIRQLADTDPNVRVFALELLGQILYDMPGELPEAGEAR